VTVRETKLYDFHKKYLLLPGFRENALILGGMNKTRIHCIRFTEAEWQEIHGRALRCGKSFGGYLRQVGLGFTPQERPTALDSKVIYHLTRTGNNLNQIARKANSGIPVPESEIRSLLDRIESVVETLRCR